MTVKLFPTYNHLGIKSRNLNCKTEQKLQTMANQTLLDIAMNHADRMILKAKNGDREAFNKLVSLWYKRIYNYCFKYIGGHDLAMDITQNVFIIVHQKLEQLNDVSRFRAWLYRIAINACHEEIRKSRRMEFSDGIVANSGEEQSGNQVADDIKYQPDARLHRKDMADLIMKALQKLAEEQRTVVIMKEYEGLKFREIAEALEISENTAKSRLYYGLKHLRTQLADVMYENQTLEL